MDEVTKDLLGRVSALEGRCNAYETRLGAQDEHIAALVESNNSMRAELALMRLPTTGAMINEAADAADPDAGYSDTAWAAAKEHAIKQRRTRRVKPAVEGADA